MTKARTKAKKQQRAKAKPMPDPGYDGARAVTTEMRLSHARSKSVSMRARPGTFEWRYGRNNGPKSIDGALFYAGSHFARMWERAGTAVSAIDMAQEGSAGWKGLPDGRVVALDDVKSVMLAVGKLSSRRLFLYCVRGETSGEIASRFDVPQRDMAVVLHEDLRAVALHLRYLKG